MRQHAHSQGADNHASFDIIIRKFEQWTRFDAMRVFTRIVERRSFTLAADDLGLPRSSVTDAVKGLEARLGVRLLQRTTRQDQSDPGWRGLLSALCEPDRGYGGRGRCLRRRQAVGIGSC